MGLRERAAFLLLIVITLQINYKQCMPRTFTKSALKRYVDLLKQVNNDTPQTPHINKSSNKNEVRYQNPFSKSYIHKKYKFPEAEYPLDNSPIDHLSPGPTYDSNYPVVKVEKPKCYSSSSIIDSLRKERKKKRKLESQLNTNNLQTKLEVPDIPGTGYIWLRDSVAFPEVQYPTRIMDTWVPYYWNTNAFAQAEGPLDKLDIPSCDAKKNNDNINLVKKLNKVKKNPLLKSYDKLKEGSTNRKGNTVAKMVTGEKISITPEDHEIEDYLNNKEVLNTKTLAPINEHACNVIQECTRESSKRESNGALMLISYLLGESNLNDVCAVNDPNNNTVPNRTEIRNESQTNFTHTNVGPMNIKIPLPDDDLIHPKQIIETPIDSPNSTVILPTGNADSDSSYYNINYLHKLFTPVHEGKTTNTFIIFIPQSQFNDFPPGDPSYTSKNGDFMANDYAQYANERSRPTVITASKSDEQIHENMPNHSMCNIPCVTFDRMDNCLNTSDFKKILSNESSHNTSYYEISKGEKLDQISNSDSDTILNQAPEPSKLIEDVQYSSFKEDILRNFPNADLSMLVSQSDSPSSCTSSNNIISPWNYIINSLPSSPKPPKMETEKLTELISTLITHITSAKKPVSLNSTPESTSPITKAGTKFSLLGKQLRQCESPDRTIESDPSLNTPLILDKMLQYPESEGPMVICKAPSSTSPDIQCSLLDDKLSLLLNSLVIHNNPTPMLPVIADSNVPYLHPINNDDVQDDTILVAPIRNDIMADILQPIIEKPLLRIPSETSPPTDSSKEYPTFDTLLPVEYPLVNRMDTSSVLKTQQPMENIVTNETSVSSLDNLMPVSKKPANDLTALSILDNSTWASSSQDQFLLISKPIEEIPFNIPTSINNARYYPLPLDNPKDPGPLDTLLRNDLIDNKSLTYNNTNTIHTTTSIIKTPLDASSSVENFTSKTLLDNTQLNSPPSKVTPKIMDKLNSNSLNDSPVDESLTNIPKPNVTMGPEMPVQSFTFVDSSTSIDKPVHSISNLPLASNNYKDNSPLSEIANNQDRMVSIFSEKYLLSDDIDSQSNLPLPIDKMSSDSLSELPGPISKKDPLSSVKKLQDTLTNLTMPIKDSGLLNTPLSHPSTDLATPIDDTPLNALPNADKSLVNSISLLPSTKLNELADIVGIDKTPEIALDIPPSNNKPLSDAPLNSLLLPSEQKHTERKLPIAKNPLSTSPSEILSGNKILPGGLFNPQLLDSYNPLKLFDGKTSNVPTQRTIPVIPETSVASLSELPTLADNVHQNVEESDKTEDTASEIASSIDKPLSDVPPNSSSLSLGQTPEFKLPSEQNPLSTTFTDTPLHNKILPDGPSNPQLLNSYNLLKPSNEEPSHVLAGRTPAIPEAPAASQSELLTPADNVHPNAEESDKTEGTASEIALSIDKPLSDVPPNSSSLSLGQTAPEIKSPSDQNPLSTLTDTPLHNKILPEEPSKPQLLNSYNPPKLSNEVPSDDLVGPTPAIPETPALSQSELPTPADNVHQNVEEYDKTQDTASGIASSIDKPLSGVPSNNSTLLIGQTAYEFKLPSEQNPLTTTLTDTPLQNKILPDGSSNPQLLNCYNPLKLSNEEPSDDLPGPTRAIHKAPAASPADNILPDV